MKLNTLFLVLVASVAFTACGNKAKKDKQVKEEAVSATATELGMNREAIEKFQLALDEMAKPKPDNTVAIDALTRSVELEPSFAEAHYNLGLIYTTLGQNKEAETYLRKAKELDTDVLDYTVALGRALAVNGQFDEAERLLPRSSHASRRTSRQ